MNHKNNNFLNFSRRSLIKYGAGFIGTGSLATALGVSSNVVTPQSAIAQNDMSPDVALEMLMAGNQRFVNNKRQNPNQTSFRLTEVASGQSPFAAILGCADSRVPVEIVFDRGFGDLFVVRVAGNLATPEEIGSLEFGTLILGAKVIMVLGHQECGAVKATIQAGELPGQLGSLIDNIQVAVERAKQEGNDNLLERAITTNVLYQIERLQRSAILSELIDTNQLKIIGANYNLATGEVSIIS